MGSGRNESELRVHQSELGSACACPVLGCFVSLPVDIDCIPNSFAERSNPSAIRVVTVMAQVLVVHVPY